MRAPFAFEVDDEVSCKEFLNSKLVGKVPLTPLTQRVAAEQPRLNGGLEKLKHNMEEQDFNRYIERLESIKTAGDTLWLTTTQQMERSVLERNYLSQLKQAFSVKQVRIFCI